MHTDLECVMQQLCSMSSEYVLDFFTIPRNLICLCNCLRFDPVDMSFDNLETCLSMVLCCLLDSDLKKKLTDDQYRQIIMTLAYFGPEAFSTMMPLLEGADIANDLIYHNPEFSAILQKSE